MERNSVERGPQLDSDMQGIKALLEDYGYVCQIAPEEPLVTGATLDIQLERDGNIYTAHLAHVRKDVIGIQYNYPQPPLPDGLKISVVGEGGYSHGILIARL